MTSIAEEDRTFSPEVGNSADLPISYDEITRFYFDEADLLDRHLYDDWFALVSQDIEYRVPVLETRNAASGGNRYSEKVFFLDENWKSLSLRMELFMRPGAFNWIEDPHSILRRIIGNVRLDSACAARAATRCNFILYRSFGGERQYDLLTGQRQDVLERSADGGLLLRSRLVHIDQTVLLLRNLSFII